ncbi:MAG: hypothetical protein RLZZ86_3109 [Cyanobacteriota bacterium]
MSKKSFKTTFDDLLDHGQRESSNTTVNKKHKETKSTFVVRCDHLDKMRAISYLERKMIKDVLADALEIYIADYEKTNGQIQLPKG